jgi:hypothetical protein
VGGDMADAVEEALNAINNRLYDNIIGGDFNSYINSMSLSTKERMVKDNLIGQTREFFNKLNSEFSDVKFMYFWGMGPCLLNSQMERVYTALYNEDYAEDSYNDFDGMYEREGDMEYFYNTALTEINVRIEYYWDRVCSLGCRHRTKRFYIVNIPKLLDFIGYVKVGMPVRTFVKEFIPDFFYDPMQPPKKRGRPKSSRS